MDSLRLQGSCECLGRNLVFESVFLPDRSSKLAPAIIALQALFVSYENQEVFGSGDRYIHTSVVAQESDAVRSHS